MTRHDLACGTGRLLGWASYLAIESYGSLTVAMFWAFTNSSVHLEGAKSVYGLILAGAQVRTDGRMGRDGTRRAHMT